MTTDTWAALPPPLTKAVTWADHGEDVILKVMFDRLGIAQPSYLDIGAFDPFHISNTALLYGCGSRGINVEANPALIEAFRQHRPEDINLCCAIGPERLRRTLHVSQNPGLSSLHGDLVEELARTIEVPTWTVSDVLDGHRGGKWPDLLTIDIEGEDFAVLEQCLPARGDRPAVVVVEHLRCTEDYLPLWRRFMPTRSYTLFCCTRSNMIWVRGEDANRLR